MEVLDEGHKYRISDIDPDNAPLNSPGQIIQFVKRFRGTDNRVGTVIQELLRVCINRTEFLNNELPWYGNVDILMHLRSALVLFENRAMLRKVEKGELHPEDIQTNTDGHFKYVNDNT
jgi:hypothetical protein